MIGANRVDKLRRKETDLRRRLSTRLNPDPPAPAKTAAAPKKPVKSKFAKNDPFAVFPTPPMTRHELLARLHELLTPRTYLEVGVRNGDSLTLSRADHSIGIDPQFMIWAELHGHVDLARMKSDDFFDDEERTGVLAGNPVDLTFIDGMHLSEFSLRDFINIEKYMSPTGIAVFDDMLPRNALEAARNRKTQSWAGDVYKVTQILLEHRPDLVVIPINTAPTGTIIVIGVDPHSTVLAERFESFRPVLEASDPQHVPDAVQTRSTAVDPRVLLDSADWSELLRLRDSGAGRDDVKAFAAQLAGLPRLGQDAPA